MSGINSGATPVQFHTVGGRVASHCCLCRFEGQLCTAHCSRRPEVAVQKSRTDNAPHSFVAVIGCGRRPEEAHLELRSLGALEVKVLMTVGVLKVSRVSEDGGGNRAHRRNWSTVAGKSNCGLPCQMRSGGALMLLLTLPSAICSKPILHVRVRHAFNCP